MVDVAHINTDNIDEIKIPPHSLQAEQSVLGGLMLDNQTWDTIADRVGDEDFYRQAHRLIFRAIKQLAEKSDPFDVVTLSEALDSLGKLNDAGGLAYLGSLANDTPSAANIAAYADIVRERSVLRQLIHVGTEISSSAFNTDGRDTVELLENAEQNGIVFIDELDKVARRAETAGADISREGVQRDLLPLVEGCTVTTKFGMVKTDHILFIAAGAFHVAKPSDLIPEMQGRFPIRVELQALDKADFVRILSEPQNALLKQYKALLATESLELVFADDAVEELALIAEQVNQQTQNIGARRLHTILERLLDDVSFSAPETPACV